MWSLNLKLGRNSDRHNCRSVDHNLFRRIQEYISHLLLHARSFEGKIRRQGLCLVGNSGDEMKGTFKSTASKEMNISTKIERYQRGITTTMRTGKENMIYSKDERNFRHGPILRGKFLVFVNKVLWANIKLK